MAPYLSGATGIGPDPSYVPLGERFARMWRRGASDLEDNPDDLYALGDAANPAMALGRYAAGRIADAAAPEQRERADLGFEDAPAPSQPSPLAIATGAAPRPPSPAQRIAIPALGLPAGTGDSAQDLSPLTSAPPVPRIAVASGMAPPPPSAPDADAPGRMRVIRDANGNIIGASNTDSGTSSLAARLGRSSEDFNPGDSPAPQDPYIHSRGELGIHEDAGSFVQPQGNQRSLGGTVPPLIAQRLGLGGSVTARTPESEFRAAREAAAVNDARDAAAGQPSLRERLALELEHIEQQGALAKEQEEQAGRMNVALGPLRYRSQVAEVEGQKYAQGLAALERRADLTPEQKQAIRSEMEAAHQQALLASGIRLEP